MIKLLKQLIVSRYVHLCIGILLLYGISWAVTQTTVEEKILDSLRKYCMADYHLRESLFEQERMEAEFYRVRYGERLESLTAGLFDYRNKNDVQAFLLPKGFLYETWEEGKGSHSYLLAEIAGRGRHQVEAPERISFDYLILGEERIKPFIEFKHGREARRLVSSGDEMVYIHRDRLDSLLGWYFDSLWQTEPKKLESHYIQWAGQKDPLTFFLYQDMKGVCEDVFVKRLFSKKAEARDYFIEQGFNHFLPSLLAMAVRMARDKDLPLHPEEKYLRALLSGLSDHPTYTLFYFMCEGGSHSSKPSLKKMWSEVKSRFDFTSPETISLERISQVSHETLRKIEKMEQ